MNDVEQKILDLFLTCEVENIDLAYALLEGQGIDSEAFIEKHFGNLLRFTGITKSNMLYPSPDEETFWTPLHDLLTCSEISVYGDVKIPDNLHWLRRMKDLKISSTEIDSLPESFVLLQQVKELTLIDNEFKEIPKEIFELKGLTYLCLAFNKIEIIPDEISKLQELGRFYIQDNKIKSISKEIGNLKQLYSFCIETNPINYNSQAMQNLLECTPKTIVIHDYDYS